MMYSLRIAAILTGLVLPSTANDAEQELKPIDEIVSDSETRTLVSRLEDYLETPVNSPKKIDALEKLEKEIERLESRNDVSLLRYIEFLGELFTTASTHSHERASSRGRTEDFTATETISGTEWAAPYWLWIPRSYRGDEPWPTIIGLHPEGKDGEWYLEEVLNDEQLRETHIIVCPTLDEDDGGWTEMAGIIKLLGLCFKEVSRHYFVDMDRIYLDGFADGGFGAVKLASRFPDVFAGVVARSAGFGDAQAEGNLQYVPVFLAVGTEDETLELGKIRKKAADLEQKKHPVTLKEMSGAASEAFPSLNGEIRDWLADKRRALFPESVQLHAESPMYGRAYWLAVKRTEVGVDPETKEPFIARVDAKYDRSQNRIDLTTENVYKLELFLNDVLIDMEKPFSVHVNGAEMFSGMKQRSWRFLLDRYFTSSDPTRLFTESVQIDVR